jgi:hypothetical protein
MRTVTISETETIIDMDVLDSLYASIQYLHAEKDRLIRENQELHHHLSPREADNGNTA